MMNPSILKNSSLSETDKIEIRQNKERDVFWKEQLTKTLYRKTHNGLNLKAALFKQEGSNWVLCIHGYRSNGKADMGFVGKRFFEQGYSVLIPDLQAHGASDGEVIGMGKLEQEDIEIWINEINSIDSSANIVLFGGSMGATATMISSGNPVVQESVECFIADCGYSSIKNILDHLIKDAFHLPKFPLVNTTMFLSKFIAHYSFYSVSTKKSLNSNKKPLLLIHGTGDKFVPYEESNKNYAYTNGEKEILFIDNAPHLSSFIYDEDKYFLTVFNFIKKGTERNGNEEKE
ncbi:alpha/beta hydrolase [Enterococcus sp. LJL90]